MFIYLGHIVKPLILFTLIILLNQAKLVAFRNNNQSRP
jgi:hypothetical protein